MDAMKIAIDCRMIHGSGIGVFIEGLVLNLPGGHEYVMIGDPKELSPFTGPNRSIAECAIQPFTVAEIFFNPLVLRADAFLCPNYSLLGWAHPKRYITVHDVLFLDRPEFCKSLIDKAVKRGFLKISCFFSKGIFTVSAFSANRLKTVAGTDRKVLVVPNGLLDFKAVLGAKPTVKDPRLLVFIGNLKKHKNISVIVKALGILNAESSDWKLAVVGAGEGLRTNDEEIIELLGGRVNDECISFLGRLERTEMLDLVSRARYLIQPSFYEGFSITPLEAMACGTQPIVSDIPAHREVYGGARVRFFDPASPHALAEVVTLEPESISQAEIRDFISSRGYEYRNAANIIISAITGAS
jgi:glycosyltransferase involved in cell wall biosynthesis